MDEDVSYLPYELFFFLQVRRYHSIIIVAVIVQINHNLISNWEDQINSVHREVKSYPEGRCCGWDNKTHTISFHYLKKVRVHRLMPKHMTTYVEVVTLLQYLKKEHGRTKT
jgi:hypothetical protein